MESIVRKFVENKVSPEELRLLQEYFKTPAGLQCLERVMDEYEGDFDTPHLALSAISRGDLILAKTPKVPSSRPWRAIAAAVTGLMIMAVSYIYVSRSFSSVEYETAFGIRKTIMLPDGTEVIMNGNSSLSYNEHEWTGDSRPVAFSGEAYFKVKSNPEKPFIVNTSEIAIKVLGTTFNVKSYSEDEEIETTLVEGRVLIEEKAIGDRAAETFELLPEHKATFTKKSGKMLLEKAQSEKEAAWVNGSLIFEDEPFFEIVKDLERRYGVKITVADKSALNCKFNTVVENESLEQVMKLFTMTGNLKYQFVDDHNLIIKGSICNPEENMN